MNERTRPMQHPFGVSTTRLRMKRRRTMLAVSVVIACLGAPSIASGHTQIRYRYTGWVSQVRMQPQHLIVAFGRARFFFNDFGNPAGTSEAYRLCYRRVGGARRCVARTLHGARVDSVRRSFRRLGRYVARWYVNGRTVASWQFLVVTGD